MAVTVTTTTTVFPDTTVQSQQVLAHLGFSLAYSQHCTLWQMLVRLKDRTPRQQRAGMVYQIPCDTCSKVHIGQMGRALEHRLKEHRRALVSGNTAQSAVAEHAVDQMHSINWTGAEVVDSDPYYCQRCALEAWHIRMEQQAMHRDEGPQPAVYNPLIHLAHPPAV